MMNPHSLKEVTKILLAPGKGILAADESISTIGKRFAKVGIDSTEENRRDYRAMLFSTPELGKSISGVILHDETIRQTSANGERLRDLIIQQGILIGIKVDEGLDPLPRFPGELITRGIDGLGQRLREYREMGAKFAKWRAVIKIGPGLPTRASLLANAHLLARYAVICQEEGLVPIVEPEVLMDGNHSIGTCAAVTELTLRRVFDALIDKQATLEELLLKPNMILPGSECLHPADESTVAEMTWRTLLRGVPAAVPGVVFLSGGQDESRATRHLARINRMGAAPWKLSFSYGRALQESALANWQGNSGNVPLAQAALARRARANSAACHGEDLADPE